MKTCIAVISLLIALLFFTTQLYAGSSLCLTSENKILLASVDDKEVKKDKEDKKIKEKKGKASREDGFDGKSSRKEGKDGKDKRIKDKEK